MLDTVGFITDLPHGLVESFKATLEEIHAADVLVHVRDISHPFTDHQKNTVLEVLKEIGVSPEILRERYVEVWNKIDLLPSENELARKLQELTEPKIVDSIPFSDPIETSQSPGYAVIPMSCQTGQNKELFLD